MIGLCAVMNTYYELTSNRESGDGRYDIIMKPKSSKYPGIIIELKATNDIEQLNDIAKNGLGQIENYTTFNTSNTELILQYGVAFCGKKAAIEFKQTRNPFAAKHTFKNSRTLDGR